MFLKFANIFQILVTQHGFLSAAFARFGFRFVSVDNNSDDIFGHQHPWTVHWGNRWASYRLCRRQQYRVAGQNGIDNLKLYMGIAIEGALTITGEQSCAKRMEFVVDSAKRLCNHWMDAGRTKSAEWHVVRLSDRDGKASNGEQLNLHIEKKLKKERLKVRLESISIEYRVKDKCNCNNDTAWKISV